MKGKPIITAKDTIDQFKVYINGILHLCISKKELIGVQSWKSSNTDFSIEFQFKTATIKSEYNEFDKWSTVLKLINEHIF